MNLISIIRYLRGERRGMGSELSREDTEYLSLHALPATVPSILIKQDVICPDVSFYQATIDFAKMRDAGARGVIIRAGQRTWEDVRFRENWSKARGAGLPRGSYWFYDSRENPKNQARLWASLIQDDAGELVHAIDLEESYGGAYGKKDDFKGFINWFQDFTGLPDHRLAIYTGYYWWLARVGNDPFFKRFDLWLAWYAQMSAVRVPPPWQEADLLFWQFTSSGNGTQYGVSSKEIDLNYFCCDEDYFNVRFSLVTGDPSMARHKITIVWPDGARERAAPSVNTTQVRNILPKGSVHYSDVDIVPDADEPYNPDKKWIKLQSGWYIAVRFPSSTGNPVRATVEPIAQEPQPEPDPTNHVVEVYVDGVSVFRKELP